MRGGKIAGRTEYSNPDPGLAIMTEAFHSVLHSFKEYSGLILSRVYGSVTNNNGFWIV
jgi:hypothetical protein